MKGIFLEIITLKNQLAVIRRITTLSLLQVSASLKDAEIDFDTKERERKRLSREGVLISSGKAEEPPQTLIQARHRKKSLLALQPQVIAHLDTLDQLITQLETPPPEDAWLHAVVPLSQERQTQLENIKNFLGTAELQIITREPRYKKLTTIFRAALELLSTEDNFVRRCQSIDCETLSTLAWRYYGKKYARQPEAMKKVTITFSAILPLYHAVKNFFTVRRSEIQKYAVDLEAFFRRLVAIFGNQEYSRFFHEDLVRFAQSYKALSEQIHEMQTALKTGEWQCSPHEEKVINDSAVLIPEPLQRIPRYSLTFNTIKSAVMDIHTSGDRLAIDSEENETFVQIAQGLGKLLEERTKKADEKLRNAPDTSTLAPPVLTRFPVEIVFEKYRHEAIQFFQEYERHLLRLKKAQGFGAFTYSYSVVDFFKNFFHLRKIRERELVQQRLADLIGKAQEDFYDYQTHPSRAILIADPEEAARIREEEMTAANARRQAFGEKRKKTTSFFVKELGTFLANQKEVLQKKSWLQSDTATLLEQKWLMWEDMMARDESLRELTRKT